MTDLETLASFHQLGSRVSVYEPELKSVFVNPQTIPWPIIWIAARFNKKHIVTSKRLPSLEPVHRCLRQAANKLKWAWVFRGEGHGGCYLRLRRGITPLCPKVVDPEVSAWISSLHNTIVGACQRSLKKAKFFRPCSNTIPLTSWGFRLMKQWGLCGVETDKQGGFAIMPKSERIRVHDEIFRNIGENERMYTHIDPWSLRL